MPFQNKTVLITGASSGLGSALAKALSQKGARLSLVARDRIRLEQTAAACQTQPLLISADVSCLSDCERAIRQTIETYQTLDYLVLNAAVSMWARFDEVSDPSIFSKMMGTNYLGPVYLTHYALPYLKKSQGMIVAISSIQGKVAVPYHSGYVASKHALQGFFETLQSELDLPILIVSPSWIQNTQLKENAIVQNGKRASSHKGLLLEDCAEQILQNMREKKSTLFLPSHYRYIPWIKELFPKLIRYLVAKKVEHR